MSSRTYILPICFLLVLGLAQAQFFLGIWDFSSRSENRTIAPAPIFHVNRLDKFPPQFDSWYEDRFPFRTPLLESYHGLGILKPDVLASRQKSFEGKSGWYFHAEKNKDIYTGKKDFTEEQHERMLQIWSERKAWLDERNIPFYFLIAPAKHYVYEEYLPGRVVRSSTARTVSKLQQKLNEALGDFVIDPLDSLQAAKTRQKVYLQYDNHWTQAGALVAVNMLIREIRKDFPQILALEAVEVSWEKKQVAGGYHAISLGKWNASEEVEEPQFPQSEVFEAEKIGFPSPQGFPYPEDYEFHFQNPRDTTGLKLLLIRDSFGETAFPYLSEFFGESLSIFDAWKLDLNESIIEAFRPDLVIFLGEETQLENILRKR